ncbi:Protein of unknown function [Lentibacillus halodurans]|uniref:DUF2975 domain-containing protein n=1 Tax=Lentibacillus halodurans TaxID=237679 RepID=A0A1I0X500_9BACI|nr:DUF2975 domain-containing protein [Lentibacillus halodurans]SFA95418.1 Protein of unknown function [Lentibacillus halodurans]
MKRGTTTFLKVAIVVIGFLVLALCLFLLPRLAGYTAETYPEFAYLRYPVLAGMYVTLIPFLFALYQSLKLLHHIENKDAFSESAVIALKQIKHCAAVIVIIYVMGMIFLGTQSALHPGIALIGLAIIFAAFIISLFAAVLQELLRSALEIKTEHDLTV